MEDLPLEYLINQKPEFIIEWFESKGYNISWNWDDTWKEAHAKSFTVAKVMKLDILQDIRKSWQRAFDDGLTFEQWRRNIEGTLKQQGWWGKVPARLIPGYENLSDEQKRLIDPEQEVQLGSMHRLRTIFEVNNAVAYNAGHWQQQYDNKSHRPYLLYIQLDRPTRRLTHKPFDNLVFHIDDSIWNYIYPPNGFFCACRVIALTKREIEQRGLKISKGTDQMPNGSTYIQFAKSVIDEGWQYNPGIAVFTPDLKDYDRDLRPNSTNKNLKQILLYALCVLKVI